MSNSRREFFKRAISVFPALAGVSLLLDACNSEEKGGIDSKNGNDLAIRKKLNYIEVASVKSKTCKLCALFIPPQNGIDCGTCSLIRGPIRKTGTCTYWAKKES